jgi:cysteine-rich repeat protein
MLNATLDAAVAALVAVCGDGIAGPGEPCDGGDDASCGGGSCLGTCQCGGTCGDGIAEAPGEECDDGNTSPGDGCDASCQLEDASALCDGVPSVSGSTISTEEVISGLDNPVDLTSPPLDPNRLFIVEQPGVIRIVENGALLPDPFMDISDRVLDGGERGLLGLAFHPDYESNGRFFVNYTRNPDGDTVIARYEVTGDPNVADPDSEIILLTIDDFASNHNGGQVAFDAAGYLYVGNGDGGGGGDPQETGQDDTSLLGKMLRMDIDVEVPPYYAVPLDNPNPGAGQPLGLIWAKGLRNPWRFSFDRANGDIYIGDVGQNAVEEIDYQPGSSTGGENYGWDIFEGSDCFDDPQDGLNCPDPPTGFTFPIHEYSHGQGCSVTGGFVYRGCAMPDLAGTYFYSDFCTSFLRTFEVSGGAAVNHANVTAALGGLSSISAFGTDARGEIYVLSLGGEIRRIIPD